MAAPAHRKKVFHTDVSASPPLTASTGSARAKVTRVAQAAVTKQNTALPLPGAGVGGSSTPPLLPDLSSSSFSSRADDEENRMQDANRVPAEAYIKVAGEDSALYPAIINGRLDILHLARKGRGDLMQRSQPDGCPYSLTPLECAVYYRQFPCLEALLALPGALSAGVQSFGNCLHLAIEMRCYPALALLKKTADWGALLTQRNAHEETPEQLAERLDDVEALSILTQWECSLEAGLAALCPTSWVFDGVELSALGAVRHLESETLKYVESFHGSGEGALLALFLALGAPPLEIVDVLKRWSRQAEPLRKTEIDSAIKRFSELGKSPRQFFLYSSSQVYSAGCENLAEAALDSLQNPGKIDPITAGRRAFYFQGLNSSRGLGGLSELIDTDGAIVDRWKIASRASVERYLRKIHTSADPLFRQMESVGIPRETLPQNPLIREALCHEINKRLLTGEYDDGTYIVPSGRCRLVGGPRAGKTVLAMTYIHNYCQERRLFVVNGSTEFSERLSYQKIAERLGVFVRDKLIRIEELRTFIFSQLDALEEPWVLFIDDAPPIIPLSESTEGIVLLTTRETEDSDRLNVPELTIDEARALILQELDNSREALAIEHMVSRLRGNPSGLMECLTTLRVLELSLTDFTRKRGDPLEVLHTLVFEKLNALSPHAGRWLGICVHFGEKNIPRHWLEEWLRVQGETEIEAETLLCAFDRYPFCTYDREQGHFHLSGPFMEWLKNQNPPCEEALDFLLKQNSFAEENPATWASGRDWASHLMAIVRSNGGRHTSHRAPLVSAGNCFSLVGMFQEAREAYTYALERIGDDEEPSVELAQLFNAVAQNYEQEGRPDEALAFHDRALDIIGRLPPTPEREKERALVLCAKGESLKHAGSPHKAKEAYLAAGEILSDRRQVTSHPTYARSLMTRAEMHYFSKEFALGLEVARHAAQFLMSKWGLVPHPDKGWNYYLQAIGHLHVGEIEGALKMCEESRKIYAHLYPLHNHFNQALLCQTYAAIFISSERFDEALVWIARGQAVLKKCLPETAHPTKVELWFAQSRIYKRQKRSQECVTALKAAIKGYKKLKPCGKEATKVLWGEAEALAGNNDYRGAIPYYEEVYEIYAALDPKDIAGSLDTLAKKKHKENQPRQAIERRLSAIRVLNGKLDGLSGREKKATLLKKALLYTRIAISEQALGDYYTACSQLQEAIRIWSCADVFPQASNIAAPPFDKAEELFGTGRHEEAIIYYYDTVLVYRTFDEANPRAIDPLLDTLIPRKREQGDLVSALYYCDKTLELFGDEMDEDQHLAVHRTRCEIQIEQGDYDGACATLSQKMAQRLLRQFSGNGERDEIQTIVAPCFTLAAGKSPANRYPYLIDAIEIYRQIDRNDLSSLKPLETLIQQKEREGDVANAASYLETLIAILCSRPHDAVEPKKRLAEAYVRLYRLQGTRAPLQGALQLYRELCADEEVRALAGVVENVSTTRWTEANQLDCLFDALRIYQAILNGYSDRDRSELVREIAADQRNRGEDVRAYAYLKALKDHLETHNPNSRPLGLTLLRLAYATAAQSRKYTWGYLRTAHSYMTEARGMVGDESAEAAQIDAWTTDYVGWANWLNSWISDWWSGGSSPRE